MSVEITRCSGNNLPLPNEEVGRTRTNLPECVFEALFKGLRTLFGKRIVEKTQKSAAHSERLIRPWNQPLRLGEHKFLSIHMQRRRVRDVSVESVLCESPINFLSEWNQSVVGESVSY